MLCSFVEEQKIPCVESDPLVVKIIEHRTLLNIVNFVKFGMVVRKFQGTVIQPVHIVDDETMVSQIDLLCIWMAQQAGGLMIFHGIPS